LPKSGLTTTDVKVCNYDGRLDLRATNYFIHSRQSFFFPGLVVAAALPRMHALSILDLSRNAIGSRGAKFLGTALRAQVCPWTLFRRSSPCLTPHGLVSPPVLFSQMAQRAADSWPSSLRSTMPAQYGAQPGRGVVGFSASEASAFRLQSSGFDANAFAHP
jgi:hypothetical protein